MRVIDGIRSGRLKRRDAVPPAFTPAAIAGIQRGWNPDGGGIDTMVPAAWGTSATLSLVASPAVRADFGPAGQDLLEFSAASSQYGIFSPVTLPSGSPATFLFVVGVKPGSSTMRLIAQGTSSTQYIAINSGSAALTVRTNGGAATTVNLPFTLNAGMHLILCRYAADGTFTPVVDGVAGAGVNVGTGGFMLDQVGRTGALPNCYLGPMLIFNTALTEQEEAELSAYFEAYISRVYYVAATGDDNAVGWNQGAPWASLGRLTSFGLRSGDTLALKGGDIWRLTAGQGGVAGVTLDGGLWGTGYANLFASIRPTDWTAVGGGVWSRTEAQHPYGYIYDTAASEPAALSSFAPSSSNHPTWHKAMDAAIVASPMGEKMAEDISAPTTPAAGKYGYSAGTIYVRCADDGNPNGRIEIPWRTVSSGVQMASLLQLNQAGYTVRRLNIRYVDGTAISQTGGGSLIDRVDVRYCASDGIDGSGSNSFALRDCAALYAGNSAAGGSDGDGYSAHGSSIVTLDRCFVGGNDKAGFDSQTTATVTYSQCWGMGSRPFATAGAGGSGVHKYRNGVLRPLAGSPYPYAVHNRGGIIRLEFATMVGIGAETGKGVYQETSVNAPTTELTNCILDNLGTGLHHSAGTLTADHIDNHAAIAAQGSVTVTSSFASDPLFTNAGALDYSLQAGSPCKAAGLAIDGIATDYAGAARAAPPGIGAYE